MPAMAKCAAWLVAVGGATATEGVLACHPDTGPGNVRKGRFGKAKEGEDPWVLIMEPRIGGVPAVVLALMGLILLQFLLSFRK